MNRNILYTIATLVTLLVVIAGLNLFNFSIYRFFAPRYVAVQTEVFQQSQQYNEGMTRDLYDIKRQYLAADDSGKAALRALAIHRFEVYGIDKLPPDLQQFYRSLDP